MRKHGANIFHLEHNISQLFKVRILRYISNSLFAQQYSVGHVILLRLKDITRLPCFHKTSASYQQTFVEFNQKWETAYRTCIQTWTITTLDICSLCIFVCFYNFCCQNWNWKNTGAMFLYILGCKNTNATLWLDLSLKLHPLYTGLDLVDFEIFFKAWITKYSSSMVICISDLNLDWINILFRWKTPHNHKMIL